MPIQQAYETDDVQLYRYAEENDLLFHPEIREVFSPGDYIRDPSEIQEKTEEYNSHLAQDNRSTQSQLLVPVYQQPSRSSLLAEI
jgi:hypothetical protein